MGRTLKMLFDLVLLGVAEGAGNTALPLTHPSDLTRKGASSGCYA